MSCHFLRLVASAFYRIGYKLHHKFFLRHQPKLHTPVVIVGNYLAGGAGKTPFTIWLAKFLQEQGKRVAILCHRAAWDEFNLLKTQLPDTKIIATKNRYATAKEIQNKFDIILCDDGFEDTRFTSAIRICLDWQEPPTSWTKILPAGPFRSLKQDHDEREIIHLNCYEKSPDIQFSIESLTNFIPGTTRNTTVICGIGSPQRFIKDILAFGQNSSIKIEKSINRPDHDKHFSQVLQNELFHNKDIVISQKDACRLPQTILNHPKLHIAIQKIKVSDKAINAIKSAIKV